MSDMWHLSLLFLFCILIISSHQDCYDIRYTGELYADLLEYDSERIVSTSSSCLVLCSVNTTCTAVSYNVTSSTCYMSSLASVIYSTPEDDRQDVHLKKANFAERRVYEFSTQLAGDSGVTLTLSSQLASWYGPEKAVDKIYMYYLVHTDLELSPWIQAELATSHYILGVKIWDRIDSSKEAQDRLANVRVTVGESDAEFENPTEALICNYMEGQPPADTFLVFCRKRMFGRFVRITAVEVNKHLNIHEMEIHGLKLVN